MFISPLIFHRSTPLLYSLQLPLFCSGPIFSLVENFNPYFINLKYSLQVRMLFLLDGKYQSVVSPDRATYLRPLQEGQLPQQLLFRHWYWYLFLENKIKLIIQLCTVDKNNYALIVISETTIFYMNSHIVVIIENVPLIFHSFINTSLLPSVSTGSLSSIECSVSFKSSYSLGVPQLYHHFSVPFSFHWFTVINWMFSFLQIFIFPHRFPLNIFTFPSHYPLFMAIGSTQPQLFNWFLFPNYS